MAAAISSDVISCSLRGTRLKTDYGSNNTSGAMKRAYGAGSWEITLNMLSRGGDPEFGRGDQGTLYIIFAGTTVTPTHYYKAISATVTNAARVNQDLSNATVEYEYRIVGSGTNSTSDLTWFGTGSTKLFMKNVLFGWDIT